MSIKDFFYTLLYCFSTSFCVAQVPEEAILLTNRMVHEGGISDFAVSDDKTKMVSSGDMHVKLWDLATRKEIKTFSIPKMNNYYGTLDVAISPDNKLVAATCNCDSVFIWETETGEKLDTKIPTQGFTTTIRFSSDGRKIFVVDGGSIDKPNDYKITVFDIEQKSKSKTIKRKISIARIDFFEKHQMFATCNGSHFSLWDLKSGQELKSLDWKPNDTHNDITNLKFSSNGQILAISSGHFVDFWHFEPESHELKIKLKKDDYVHLMAFSSDDKLFAYTSWHLDEKRAKTGTLIHILDLGTGREIQTIDIVDTQKIYFGADNKTLIESNMSKIRVWDIETGKQILRNEGHLYGINSYAFGQDILVTGSEEGTLKVWSTESKREIKTITDKTDYHLRIDISANNKTLLVRGRGFAEIWDLGNNQKRAIPEAQLRDNSFCVGSMNTDGKYLAYRNTSDSIVLWDIHTNNLIRVLETKAKTTNSILFSPNGKIVAATNEGHLRLWEVATGQLVNTFSNDFGRLDLGAISLDNKLIAMLNNAATEIILYDTSTKQLLKSIKTSSKSDPILSIAISPDSKILVCGSIYGTITFFDIEKGTIIKKQEMNNAVRKVTFSPDGKFLNVGTSTFFIKLQTP